MTLLKKIIKETIAKILYSVMTKIKTESKEAVSRHDNLCRNIKSCRLTDELCRDKRQFYRDRNCSDYNTSKLRQVFLCCDKVFNIKPAQGRIVVATKKILSQHSNQNSQPRETQSLSRQRLFLSGQTKHEGGGFLVAIRRMTKKKFLLRHNQELKAKPVSRKEVFCCDNKS